MITLKQLKSKLETDFGWSNLECEENQWLIDNLLEDAIKAINVIQCCKSDSELLKCDHDLVRQGNYIVCKKKDCDYKILG